MYGLLYECKFLTIEETNKKKIKKLVNQNPLYPVDKCSQEKIRTDTSRYYIPRNFVGEVI